MFGGCRSAIFAAAYPDLGIGFVGVALAFGLTVLTMVYAVGHISGAHFNPAVSLGLWAGGMFPGKHLLGYNFAHVFRAIAAAGVLYVILSGKSDFVDVGSFAANGYGDLSPGGYNMMSVLITEFLLTMFFLLIILGSTYPKAPSGFAGIAIGLALFTI